MTTVVDRLRKMSVAVFLAADGAPAAEISDGLKLAASTIEQLVAALKRTVDHFTVLPAEFDEPNSVMGQARAAIKKTLGE